MPNPFTEATTNNVSTALSDAGNQQTEIQSALPAPAVDRTARLAAVALHGGDVLSNYQALTAQYTKDIQASGDASVRYKAAAQETAQNLKGILATMNDAPEIDPSGALLTHLQSAAQSELDGDLQSKARYALEKQAYQQIQGLAAGGDYTQAKVMMDLIQHGDAEAQIQDLQVKKMVLGSLVAKQQAEVSDQPWYRSVADFAASTIGAMTFKNSFDRGGNVEVDQTMRHWWDFIFSGRRQRDEAASLYSLPIDEFGRAVEDHLLPAINAHVSTFGYTNHSEALNLLSDIANTRPTEDINAEDINNLATLIPLEKVVSIPGMMVRAGARREAADLIATATLESIRSGTENAAAATGVTEGEIISGNLPSALDVNPKLNTVPLTGDTLAGVERGSAIAEMIPEIQAATQSGRFTNAELQEAITKNQERLAAQYGRDLKNFDVQPERLTSGQVMYNMTFDLGKKKGGGFASQTIAEQQAQAMAVGTHEIIQDESGQWFIRETRNMPETSFYTTNLDPGLKKTGLVGRLLLGARQIDDDLTFAQARASSNARNKILTGVKKDFGKRFEGVFGTQEGDYLSNAAAWGENKGVWLSRDEMDELFSRQGAQKPISDKAWDAYNAMRDINDLEFALRNDVDYATKRAKGFESVSFDGYGFKADRANALIDRSPQSLPEGGRARIFDASTGIHYNESNPLTAERLEQMAHDGYMLVSVEEPIEANGVTIKHFLMKKNEGTIEALRRDQLAYRAGGHRLYADKYFVKQAAYGVQADTKEKFLKSPNVFVTGTKAETEKWANVMEQARQMYKAGSSASLLDEILAPLQGWDGERFVQAVESGKIDPNTEITAMYDREMPKEYIQTPTAAQFVGTDEAGYSGWLRTNGRMYYSSKGDALEDWAGGTARTVDPFETANIAIGNVANLASFADYKMSAVTRWLNTFEPYLTYGHLPKGASDLTKFAESKYNANLDQSAMFSGDRIRQRMEAQRQIIERNLGWRTDWDRRMEAWQANINAWVMGNDPTSIRHEIGRKMVNWWAESNPINAVRGFVFDTKMGFFNVAQFPLQIQTMLSTAALAGFDRAGPAFMNFPLMRRYLMGRMANEQFIEQGLQLGLHKAMNLEPEEYRVMMRMAKNSGFFEIHNSHQMMNYFGPNAVIGGAKNGYNKFMETGRFFFNEGEMWNRVMAWQVAFRDIAETARFPGKLNAANEAQFFEEFQRRVAAKADDYSMNMTKESGAAWQHGLMSIPTQFWAYNARMLEAYFGKQFTLAQKTRLALAQTFFYGAAGLPLSGWLADKWNENQGQAPAVDSLQGMIQRGAIDEVIYKLTGADVLAGKRAGTGTWTTDLIQELLGSSPYGEKSFAEVIGGSTYQIVGDTAKTLMDLVRYATAESGAQDHPLTREGMLRLASNISTFSYGMKAYMGFQYNAFVSNKGTLVASDLPTSDAFFFALGIAPGEQDDVSAMMAWKKDRKAQVDDLAKFITNQRARLAIEPEHRDEISEEVNAAVRLLPPDLRVAALKEANHRTPRSLHETLALQVAQDKKTQEMINAYGQTH